MLKGSSGRSFATGELTVLSSEGNIQYLRSLFDFYCESLKLVVEVDGDIHDNDEVKEYDERRERKLFQLGYQVIRFKNDDVIANPDEVVRRIQQVSRK